MTSSVLEKDYIEPTRPYSQAELKFNRERLYKNLRIGEHKTKHERCGHCYKVRKNGRKEKEILESGNVDTGNCSVCWKLSRTKRHNYNSAKSVVFAYMECFENEPKSLTYEDMDLERVFYTWLYGEN
jgi:hypothetical protein